MALKVIQPIQPTIKSALGNVAGTIKRISNATNTPKATNPWLSKAPANNFFAPVVQSTVSSASNTPKTNPYQATNVATPPPAPIAMPASNDPYAGITESLNQMYANMQAAQLERDRVSRENLIADLGSQATDYANSYQEGYDKLQAEKSGLAPQYQALKNASIADTLKQLTGIKEQMANTGQLYGGGAGVNQQVTSDERIAGENRINQYNLQQLQQEQSITDQANAMLREKESAVNKINDQITRIKSGGVAADNATIAELEAKRIDAVNNFNIAQANRNDQIKQQSFQNDVTKSGLTGYYNPTASEPINPATQQYSDNFQKKIDELKAINPNDPFIHELEVARNAKIASDPALQAKYGTMTAEAKSNIATANANLNAANLSTDQKTASALVMTNLLGMSGKDAATYIKNLTSKELVILGADGITAIAKAVGDKIDTDTKNALEQQRIAISKYNSTKLTAAEKTAAEKDTLAQASDSFNSTPADVSLIELFKNKDLYVKDLGGITNYNKVVDEQKENYYQQLVSEWSQDLIDDPQMILNTIQAGSNSYKKYLTLKRFNDLTALVRKAVNK